MTERSNGMAIVDKPFVSAVMRVLSMSSFSAITPQKVCNVLGLRQARSRSSPGVQTPAA